MDLKDAQILAIELMLQHGLGDWRFFFDHAKKRFGCCDYLNKTIHLSSILVKLNVVERVRNTILHEIAHALSGLDIGHGSEWKRKCREIGAIPERCYSTAEGETNLPPANIPLEKYTAICKVCGHTTGYSRRLKRNNACGFCCNKYSHGKFDSKFILTIKQNY